MFRNFILFAAITLLFTSCSKTANDTYTLLTVSSVNGQIFPKTTNNIKYGGFSLISSQVKQLRSNKENGNIVLIGNSNFIYGKVEAYFTSGKAIIDIMNELNFDALILGHREFYFGLDILENLSKQAKFPFISANVVKKDSSRFDFIKPYLILSDKKTAILGISSGKVIDTNLEKDIKDILLLDISETTKKYIDILEEKGVNRIILVGDFQCVQHSSPYTFGSDLCTVINSDKIDVFIGTSTKGDRENINCICNTSEYSKILSSDINGTELLMYKFSNKNNYEETRIFDINSNLLKPDDELAQKLSDLNLLVKETAGEVLGYAEDNIPHLEGSVYDKESKLGDMISDIMRKYTGTDIMLLNSGKIRNGFIKGPVTLMNLYNILPYEGTLVKVTLTGEQIITILESSCALKMTKSFLQVSGIKFKFDSGRSEFDRVLKQSVEVDNKPLDLKKHYSVTVTKYMFNGGDQYTEFDKLQIEPEIIFQKQMREILKDYIIEQKTLKIHNNNRIINVAL